MTLILRLPNPILKGWWVTVTDEMRGIYQPTDSRYTGPTPNPGPIMNKLFNAFVHACKSPGWNPKTVVMGGNQMAIDYCAEDNPNYIPTKDANGKWSFPPLTIKDFQSFHVINYDDHPFLSDLPSNAPRTIKHLYRKEIRLRHKRAEDAWGFYSDMAQAEQSLQNFNKPMDTE